MNLIENYIELNLFNRIIQLGLRKVKTSISIKLITSKIIL